MERRASRGASLALAALLALGAVALLVSALLPSPRAWGAGDLLAFTAVESVRGEPLEAMASQAPAVAAPPAHGWVPVTLPDAWSDRWPTHDGVVWYLLRFTLPPDIPAEREFALALDAMNMAGAVWLDGQLLWRDERLAEPGLTRAWNQPRFVRLGALRAPGPGRAQAGDEHTLLVRITGYAPYVGGLSEVWLGAADPVQRLHAQAQWWRVGLQQVSLGVNVAMALLFLMLWICWPRERLYGWFALTALAWSAGCYNQVATGVWPLRTVPQWQFAMAALLLLFAGSYLVFVFRFAGRRHVRCEAALACTLGAAVLAGILAMGRYPQALPAVRMATLLAGLLLFMLAVAYVLQHALRTRSPSSIALALAVVIALAGGLHDMAALLAWIDDTRYYAVVCSTFSLVSMAFLLAWRLRSAFEREAYFNAELREKVEGARAELTAALARQRALELANARQAERIGMVRDLHDGLGGTLVHAAACWGEAPQVPVPAPQALAVLAQISDDLRLIIDTTAHVPQGDLQALLAAPRRRLMSRLQAAGIDARWHAEGLDGVRLEGARALNLLRLLQEAVTNAIRHSGARRVGISVLRRGACLQVCVQDDGRGFDATRAGAQGMGLANMRQRAIALEAVLQLETAPGQGCRVAVDVAWQAADPPVPPVPSGD